MNRNRVVVKVEAFYDDAPNPISTEFEFEYASPSQVEAASNKAIAAIRTSLEK